MNPVTKIGIALILTLSFLCFVEGYSLVLGSHCNRNIPLPLDAPAWHLLAALVCVKCTLFNSTKNCVSQPGHCATKKDQKCLLWTVTSGGFLSYGIQTCWTHCLSRFLVRGHLKVEFNCCDSSSLCNEL
ncbi:secreted seminal-vesicle Ly-6 protein 1-like [Grammomys surdaster]|uniref:secreted seminal-vesicle Ly-6 protein 1-like n=1 Tax=Grammomys surdaster TaxID=491861 RepID=UPI00109FC846|nr:secreted seminal-vesicle Ly-6 protein 1-like [Grammomys surdaster]